MPYYQAPAWEGKAWRVTEVNTRDYSLSRESSIFGDCSWILLGPLMHVIVAFHFSCMLSVVALCWINLASTSLFHRVFIP